MAKQPGSMFDFDLGKAMQDFKVPGVDVEGLMTSQRKNLEALAEANKLAIEGMQALFRRQAEILRQSVEEASAVAQQVSSAGSPQDAAMKQTELAKEAFERTVTNARELTEIVNKSNQEAFALLNRRFSAVLDEVKQTIGKAKGK